MFIQLSEYELNTLLRRRDDTDYADLRAARVLSNSLCFSETHICEALALAVGGSDTLLFLDLRVRPDSRVARADSRRKAKDLPPLELPEPERFVYKEQPKTQALKTYRLEYLLGRSSRDVPAAYEEVIDGTPTTVMPAPGLEIVRASLECEKDDLAAAVKLLAAPANGHLSWLCVTLHDDAYRGDRPIGHGGDFAEPNAQIHF